MRLPLIDGQLQDPRWRHVESSDGVRPSPVSLEEWLSDPSQQAIQLAPDDDYRALLPHVDAVALVAIDFPDLNDGRGFSQARALREAGFSGELRATGRFVQDQLHYLRRCGFNAFELPEGIAADTAADSLYEYSVSYQAAQDQPEPLFKRMR